MKRIKRIISVFTALCMGLMIFGCHATPPETITVNVLAAASLTDVMGELEQMYETEHPGIDLVFSFAGSGALQTQIEEGAPADIFISAAETQMNNLRDEGLIDNSSIRNLLINKVVLIVPEESDTGLDSFEGVTADNIVMIGLGDPESVPAGKYAEQIFTYLGIWDEVASRANFGTDVRTVLRWVEAGEVDCGVVYSTDALTADAVTVVAEAPEGSHDPVVYPAGIISGSEVSSQAEEFLAYLEGSEASSVFESYGFTMAG